MIKDPLNGMNPVSIIALFAALSEASAATALPFLAEDNQDIYVWFLIAFPSALTCLFFLTLNFNHNVLYAPSDFSNEKNFLNIFKRSVAEANITAHVAATDTSQRGHFRPLSRLLLHPTDTLDLRYAGPISNQDDIDRLFSRISTTTETEQRNDEHKIRWVLVLKKQTPNDHNNELTLSLLQRSTELSHPVKFVILDANSSNAITL